MNNKNTQPIKKEEPLYSLALLQEFSEGKEGFVEKMVQLFKEETPKSIQLLKEYYSRCEYKKVSDVVHKMRTSIDMLEMKTIQKDVRLIEEFAKEQKNLDQLPDLINRVIATCELVITLM
jgi:HPt (histidine-containing phosphotransfer) domain-containing protein